MYINCTVVIYIFILFNKNQKQNVLRLDPRFLSANLQTLHKFQIVYVWYLVEAMGVTVNQSIDHSVNNK